MPLFLHVNAPGLLTKAQQALGTSQQGLGKLLGVSRRTMVRWQGGRGGPSYDTWLVLVRHVYRASRPAAAEIAQELGATLVSLGLEAPPAPVAATAPVAQPPRRPAPAIGDLVDSIVCAAAEAVATTPQAMRPALLAAFERAASLGLEIDDVHAALRPASSKNSG
jgi:DNA-binding XRE family transcriptional regulator